jgi:hypothetical protein
MNQQKNALMKKLKEGYTPYLKTLEKHGLVEMAQELGITPKPLSSNKERAAERGYSKRHYWKSRNPCATWETLSKTKGLTILGD